jgi:hypothetical protein
VYAEQVKAGLGAIIKINEAQLRGVITQVKARCEGRGDQLYDPAR